MTVNVGGQMFGVPLDGVVETIRVPRTEIRAVGDAQVVVTRKRAIPLLRLGEALGRSSTQDTGEAVMVIVAASGQLAALEVDRLGATMDVMLKPPNGLLSHIQKIAGTTMLGDGSVLLILDVESLLS
jgi:two-component system chemotaxis sensor kinase CheA